MKKDRRRMQTMRTGLIAGIFVVLASLVQSPAAPDDASKADLKSLQGEWQMTSGTRGGLEMPEAMVQTGRRSCKDDQVTVTMAGATFIKTTIVLDASKNPRTI